MTEFQVILGKLDGVHARIDRLAVSLAGCQAICADGRRRRALSLAAVATIIGAVVGAAVSSIVQVYLGG